MSSVELISFLQGYLTGVDPFLRFISYYGKSHWMLLIATILFLSGYSSLGSRLAIVVTLSGFFFTSARHLFMSDRPYWLYCELYNGVKISSYGMPSGHTQIHTDFWGLLGLYFKKNWFWALAIIMILSIGLSRIYLGVHFLSQVLAGLCVGIFLLTIYALFQSKIIQFLRSKSKWLGLSYCIIVVLTFMLIVSLSIIFFGHMQMKSLLPYSSLIKFHSLLLGCVIGAYCAKKVKPSWFLFFTRAIPGMLTAILIWQVIPILIHYSEMPVLYYFLCFLSYFFLVIWITIIWPYVHENIVIYCCSIFKNKYDYLIK